MTLGSHDGPPFKIKKLFHFETPTLFIFLKTILPYRPPYRKYEQIYDKFILPLDI